MKWTDLSTTWYIYRKSKFETNFGICIWILCEFREDWSSSCIYVGMLLLVGLDFRRDGYTYRWYALWDYVLATDSWKMKLMSFPTSLLTQIWTNNNCRKLKQWLRIKRMRALLPRLRTYSMDLRIVLDRLNNSFLQS